jgi:hypothetical protein
MFQTPSSRGGFPLVKANNQLNVVIAFQTPSSRGGFPLVFDRKRDERAVQRFKPLRL